MKIKKLQVVLTPKCNLACSYCLRHGDLARGEVPYEHLVLLFRQAHRDGLRDCTLTGGEAALYGRFNEVCRLIGTLGWKATIESNGKIVDTGWLKSLTSKIKAEKLTFLISLDHYNSQIHDAYRGTGSHTAALRAITLLRDRGIRVITNAVVTKDSFTSALEISKYLRFLIENGVNECYLSPLIVDNMAKAPRIGPDRLQFVRINKVLEQVARRYKRIINIRYLPKGENSSDCRKIGAGVVVVSAKGYHPCLYLEDVVLKKIEHQPKHGFAFTRSAVHLRESVLATLPSQNRPYNCQMCVRAFSSYIKNFPFSLNKK